MRSIKDLLETIARLTGFDGRIVWDMMQAQRPAGAALLPEIAQIEDVTLLQAVEDGIEFAGAPEELRQL